MQVKFADKKDKIRGGESRWVCQSYPNTDKALLRWSRHSKCPVVLRFKENILARVPIFRQSNHVETPNRISKPEIQHHACDMRLSSSV